MRFNTIAWLGLAGLVYSGPALALTITNIDPKPHTVTVTAGGKDNKITIEAQQASEAPCEGGCSVKLENGEVYQLKGGETISIEDGAIFVDSSPDAFVENPPSIDPDTVPDEPEEEEDTGDAEEDTGEADQAE
jgi:hypothetical protein